MPVGPLINALAVLLGGVLGALLGSKVPERLRLNLPLTLGAASMGMGIAMIAKVHTLPPVVLALLLGSVIGELARLEKGIEWLAGRVRGPVDRFFSVKASGSGPDPDVFMQQFVGLIVLFCASGTGIFGALNEGMTGDYTVLLSKSFLDFCTALIFATSLGYIVPTVALPQAVILLILFFGAGLILPLTTPEMIADFSAAGGIIMLVTGLRICGIKAFPVANMLPALLLVMPLSHFWTILFG